MEGGLLFNGFLPLHHRSELVTVHDHPLAFDVFLDLAGDHFHLHADADGLLAEVSQLGGDHGTFFEGDHRHGIRRLGFKTGGGVAHHSVGIHLAFTAESELGLGFTAALGANIARGEDLGFAVRADFTNKGISLLFQSPMAWNFHF